MSFSVCFEFADIMICKKCVLQSSHATWRNLEEDKMLIWYKVSWLKACQERWAKGQWYPFIRICLSHTLFSFPVYLRELTAWCFCLFIYFFVSCSVMSKSLQPMDYSLPDSTIHGIFQARVLEWFAISFSRGSSLLRDWTLSLLKVLKFFLFKTYLDSFYQFKKVSLVGTEG